MNNHLEDARAHVRVWSAGGVVAREVSAGRFEVAVCRRESENLWALPKGMPDASERPLETAVREVNEETGLEVEVVAEAGTIAYSFSRSDVPNPRYDAIAGDEQAVVFDKQVHFYLMKAVGGDTSLHDREFDAVVWLPAEEALRRLTYEGESGIVEKALAILEGRSDGSA